jgi:hypothetical protein
MTTTIEQDDLTTEQTTAGSADCYSGRRNRFFRGKQMKVEEFRIEQSYFLDRRHLLNRALFGWGVVQGLGLERPRHASEVTAGAPGDADEHHPQGRPFRVLPGLALDEQGREAILTETTQLSARNTFLLGSDCRPGPFDRVQPGRYVLALHYAERQVGDAHGPGGCRCEHPEKNFVCETAIFSLRPLGKDGCCPCAEQSCERGCRCQEGRPCPEGPGRHACLCQWVAQPRAPENRELCEWNGYWIDPASAVDLACITVTRAERDCDPAIGTIDDDCGPRRLVKSTDLIYDLMRGCDLVRIDHISWSDWHLAQKPVDWADFAARFHCKGGAEGTTDFVVKFSGPVQIESLRPDAVAMTVFTAEQATGWQIARRVPIAELDTTPDPDHGGKGCHPLPPGTTNQLRVKVKPRWIRDELDRDDESWLTERQFEVEVTIMGDTILDCHDHGIDANVRGKTVVPSGNGTPGGTFVSSFRVSPKPLDKAARAG